MNAFDRVATKVVGDMQEKTGEAFDPAAIGTFAQMIMDLIAAFKDCKKPSEVQAVAKNPGLFQRIRLRQIVRDNLGAAGFRAHGSDAIVSLQNVGAKLTVDEVQELYDSED